MSVKIKSFLLGILRAAGLFIFFWLLGFFLVNTGSLPAKFLLPAAIIMTGLIFVLKHKTDGDPKNYKHLIFWTIAVLISFPFAMLSLTLGENDIEPIILFFRDNGMEEIRAIGRGSFQTKTTVFLTFLYILFSCGVYFNKRLRGFQYVLLISGLLFLIVNPVSKYIYRIFIPDPILANFNIEEHFKAPVFTKSPALKKNMIIVYLESLEQTYANLESTKEQYGKIDPLMADALVATQLMQTNGTNFTIAGIVATQCGVPLLPSGLNQGIYRRKLAEMEVRTFYDRIECLGDRLSSDGYTLSYMNGADARKYSKRSFLTQHGYSRIFDELSVPENERAGRENMWGLNDEFLYEHLHKEVDYLAAQGDPFVLSYLTISTHGPDAFLDTNCAQPPEGVSKIPAAIGCSFDSLINFYDYIEAKGLMKDTIFVVMSDHLAMTNTVSEELKIQDQRENLFFVKGAGAPIEISKLATPMDVYPTLLELLGYEIQDNHANMGVSMLSDKQSMIQKYGDNIEMSKRLTGNHALGNFLWERKSP
jgi:phosphoglycerol transferase